MRKPKTARLKKKKGFDRDITLQEAFDVIAEELVKIGHEECAFIGYENVSFAFSSSKLHLHVMEGGEEVSLVKSTKTARELERSFQK
ncbi:MULTISPECIES: hypothetical protein [Bacillus amyloliquefaciens group]|uniref:hypothetical protein n=1 Tax=Bacillus amyloliquefaciens group TaxID=1938374 RepID=UPI0002AADC3D|nr:MULTISPECIES: hypothetical protein [Bacillus amyloliquefaciens group]APA01893.1 hypothetical protein BK055_04850 [Bacillus velezensis]UBM13932.1 hypothetical protein LAZ96_14920 [Bacillus velezensis]UYQ97987.1 hypothetical protein NYR93_19765 [Bacillus velezensis]WBY43942.1 hypothetical protein PF996_10875 [Bacillus velezensis]WPH29392.1 hypothetical protein SD459_09940 [Bacillus velezensis]